MAKKLDDKASNLSSIPNFSFDFRKLLIEWHRKNRRTFPWRQTKDPFKVLLAEVMLQRTRAEQVNNVFNRLFNKFPNVRSMYVANWTEIEEILRPLGLTHRIPRIRAMIEQLVKKYEGRVPNSYRSLLRLPGVGRYIASAVLCFGFNKRVPIVDSNIARFYLRFFGLKDIKKRSHEDKRILILQKNVFLEKM